LGVDVVEPVPILQVLLLHDDPASSDLLPSRDLGPVLWAVLQEVENLYNTGRVRGAFRRHYLADEVPEQVLPGLSPGWEGLREAFLTSDIWRTAKGKYSQTYDHAELARGVRSWLPREAGPEFRLLLVTNQEITPPPKWRYVLRSSAPGGWWGNDWNEVVSTAPMDPAYWGRHEARRLMTIKHRARVLCCSMVGQFVGLTSSA
jgi:hypothetical protein